MFKISPIAGAAGADRDKAIIEAASLAHTGQAQKFRVASEILVHMLLRLMR